MTRTRLACRPAIGSPTGMPESGVVAPQLPARRATQTNPRPAATSTEPPTSIGSPATDPSGSMRVSVSPEPCRCSAQRPDRRLAGRHLDGARDLRRRRAPRRSPGRASRPRRRRTTQTRALPGGDRGEVAAEARPARRPSRVSGSTRSTEAWDIAQTDPSPAATRNGKPATSIGLLGALGPGDSLHRAAVGEGEPGGALAGADVRREARGLDGDRALRSRVDALQRPRLRVGRPDVARAGADRRGVTPDVVAPDARAGAGPGRRRRRAARSAIRPPSRPAHRHRPRRRPPAPGSPRRPRPGRPRSRVGAGAVGHARV